MELLNGKKLSEHILLKLKNRINYMITKPYLVVFLVGEDPASIQYTDMKKRKCEELGCICDIIKLDNTVVQEQFEGYIKHYSEMKSVNGIMIQFPLPKHLDSRRLCDLIPIKKDVDGLNSNSLKKILINEEAETNVPCTPKGIITLLEHYKIEVEGKKVVILGYSDIVGKPLALMMINRKATVTICRSGSDIQKEIMQGDIIISAMGKPHIINDVKQDAIIIDIGTSKLDGKIVGDVNFDAVKDKCSFITPVPGGVGPMTIVSLVENLIELSENHFANFNFNSRVTDKCKDKSNVFIYVAKDDELDTRGIIKRLFLRRKNVIVPVMADNFQIIPVQIFNLKDLKENKYGILEPINIVPFDKDKIDIFFVPGRKFDKFGNREGRGLGYFDRFLEDVKNKKTIIGLCYKHQVFEKLEPSFWDVPMDSVICK